MEVTASTRSGVGRLADEVLFLNPIRRPFSRHGLQVGYLTALLGERPHDCLCTWVPEFTMAWRRPAGPSDPRPWVQCWQATGFTRKYPNSSCPAKYRHG